MYIRPSRVLSPDFRTLTWSGPILDPRERPKVQNTFRGLTLQPLGRFCSNFSQNTCFWGRGIHFWHYLSCNCAKNENFQADMYFDGGCHTGTVIFSAVSQLLHLSWSPYFLGMNKRPSRVLSLDFRPLSLSGPILDPRERPKAQNTFRGLNLQPQVRFWTNFSLNTCFWGQGIQFCHYLSCRVARNEKRQDFIFIALIFRILGAPGYPP